MSDVKQGGIWTTDSSEGASIDLPLLHRVTAAFDDLAVESASISIAGRTWHWKPMPVLTVVMPSQGNPHSFLEGSQP